MEGPFVRNRFATFHLSSAASVYYIPWSRTKSWESSEILDRDALYRARPHICPTIYNHYGIILRTPSVPRFDLPSHRRDSGFRAFSFIRPDSHSRLKHKKINKEINKRKEENKQTNSPAKRPLPLLPPSPVGQTHAPWPPTPNDLGLSVGNPLHYACYTSTLCSSRLLIWVPYQCLFGAFVPQHQDNN